MKKKLGVIILFIWMGMMACSKPVEKTNPTEKKEVVLDEKGETKKTATQPEEIAVNKIEYGTEQLSLKGKKLDQLTVKGTDNPYYCNLEENLKMKYEADNIPVLVCKDPVYDITYYVNYGRDNYIYAYRNGNSEVVVEIPASELFCKDGELYFIAETDGKYQFSGFTPGNILKYNPTSGNVVVVVNCNADNMIVYPDGIFYKQLGELDQVGMQLSRKEESFFYSFATEESSSWPLGASDQRRWKGYLLQIKEEVQEFSESDTMMKDPVIQELIAQGYKLAGVGTGVIDTISLVDIQGNVKETLQNVKGIPRNCWISGDFIYYVKQEKGEEEAEKRSILRQYNKQTGAHEDIAVLGYSTNLFSTDMIFYNNVVYFSNGLRVELNTGAQYLMQYADGSLSKIECFYTDGEILFCVSKGKLWRFHEQPGTFVYTKEFVAGIPVDIGSCTYRLLEP